MAAVERKSGELVGKGSVGEEGLFGVLSGIAYGVTAPLVGAPFDLVKTKMQAEKQHRNRGALDVAKHVWREQGARGFFRGLLPPLLGSAAYRGILFGAYSATFTACEGTALGQPIPGTAGLRPSVLLGAAAGAAARTAIETPLEVMKVRRHLGETWQTGTNVRSIFTPTQILELYKGTTPTFLRTAGMLGTFFVLVDYSARFFPEAVNTPLVGPFFKGGICTTAGWFIAWPFETVKSRVQGDTTGKLKGQSTMKILRTILAEDGVRRGLYRGFLPGALRSFVSNGASMVMFQAVQSMRPAPKSGK